MLEIVQYPHKILRLKTDKVRDFSDSQIQNLVEEMKQTMVKADGIGLAANQVNSSKRILVVNTDEGAKAFINPLIFFKSFFKKDVGEEGCLSFPGIFGLVKRPSWIWVRYQDQNGVSHWLKAKGLLARVLQHEVDHLNGVLYIDKIIKYTKNGKRAKQLMEQATADEK